MSPTDIASYNRGTLIHQLAELARSEMDRTGLPVHRLVTIAWLREQTGRKQYSSLAFAAFMNEPLTDSDLLALMTSIHGILN